MTSIKAGFSIVTDGRTLSSLAKAKKIIWPVMTNNSKKIPFKYCDEVEGVGWRFTHNGKNYELRYHSGCFYPYVYIVY